MGDIAEPRTETVSREPEDVTGFRQQTIQPFLEGIINAPQSQANPFAQAAAQSPEQQVLEQTQPALQGLIQGGGQQAAQQVIDAAQPRFQENLETGIAEFMSQTPSTFNTAAGVGAGDIAESALRDFNLFQQQALQQGQQTALGAAGQLGQLAQGAGRAQTQRFVNPTLQLMQGATQFAQPVPPEVVAQPSPLSQIISGAGAAAQSAIAASAMGSSIRFKKDVTPLEKIKDLNLYEYSYKGEDRRRLGAIVEDETTPEEWVTGGDHIDLYSMVSTLAAAVGELAEKVEALE